ncbi:hypothetical protein ETD86_34630 [Nonomuraea turkmeniaca]|uniref:Uncharacterized protein n=1 Tax=Nonomuraea turkmeniaca TaxID=103838 RepID=A0A5S4F6K1_9ACTN|nr:hypothetical protein [Nonomuraea turkmeniaca]TMR11813.1 hypothetical protein ETD86_34630 [Nonomuraea turkmeniaca]
MRLRPAARAWCGWAVLPHLEHEGPVHVAERLSGERGVRMIALRPGAGVAALRGVRPTTAGIHHFTSRTLASMPGVPSWTAGVQVLTVMRGFLMARWAEDRVAAAVDRVAAAVA